jgi:16S rRNA processing protein RimM
VDSASGSRQDWAVIARLGKTRGLKGEIYGEGSWPAEKYAALPGVWLRYADGRLAAGGDELKPVSVLPYKGGLIFRFEGIETIDAAEPLQRLEVVVPKEERPQIAEDEIYLADLIGCAVVHRRTGAKLGTVTGWQETGGPVVLEVAGEGETGGDPLLIPFARAICVEIDPAAKRVVVDPPEGLLELNRAGSGA